MDQQAQLTHIFISDITRPNGDSLLRWKDTHRVHEINLVLAIDRPVERHKAARAIVHCNRSFQIAIRICRPFEYLEANKIKKKTIQ